MITQALKHNNKISVSTAPGTRMVGNRLITGKAGTTTVCRQDIAEIEDGILEDDATIDEARSVLAGYVLAGDLSEAEVEAILSLYTAWVDIEVGAWIAAEQDGSPVLLRYDGVLYKVSQGHWKQADYTPDTAVSLFAKAIPEGVIPDWEQMVYDADVLVSHVGRIWKSLMDANGYEPGQVGSWRDQSDPPMWVAPAGSVGLWQVDDQATYNGHLWINTHPDNSHTPGVYGWTDLGPI